MPLLGSLGNAAEIAYGPPSDFSPDVFDFIDISGVEPLDQGSPRVLYTGTKQITGVKSGLGVTISTVESLTSTGFVLDSDYANIGYSITNGIPGDVTALTYTNVPGTILPDQYITVRLTLEPSVPVVEPASFDASDIRFSDFNPRYSQTIVPDSANETGFNLTYTTELVIGETTIDWVVQTRNLDNTPTAFVFTGQEVNPPVGSGSAVGSATTVSKVVYTENTATILGLETGYKFQINIDPDSAGISIDGNTAIAVTEVSNGDVIHLKSITPSTYSSTLDHTVEIGDFSTNWQIETEDENLNIIFTPSDFTDIPFGTPDFVYESDEITLSGFSPLSDLPAQVSGLTTGYYQVERSSLIVKGYEDADIEVQEGDIIKLRLQAPSGFSTSVSTTFSVGNTSADWSITTIEAPS